MGEGRGQVREGAAGDGGPGARAGTGGQAAGRAGGGQDARGPLRPPAGGPAGRGRPGRAARARARVDRGADEAAGVLDRRDRRLPDRTGRHRIGVPDGAAPRRTPDRRLPRLGQGPEGCKGREVVERTLTAAQYPRMRRISCSTSAWLRSGRFGFGSSLISTEKKMATGSPPRHPRKAAAGTTNKAPMIPIAT